LLVFCFFQGFKNIKKFYIFLIHSLFWITQVYVKIIQPIILYYIKLHLATNISITLPYNTLLLFFDALHKLKFHVSVCLLTMKVSQWVHKNFCSYGKSSNTSEICQSFCGRQVIYHLHKETGSWTACANCKHICLVKSLSAFKFRPWNQLTNKHFALKMLLLTLYCRDKAYC